MPHRPLLVLGLVAGALVPAASTAQERPHPRWEIPGLDFHRDGAWRKPARRVATTRAQLRARRKFAALNAPLAAGAAPAGGALASGAALSGVVNVPAILFKYKDTNPAVLRTAAQYDAVLFAAAPPSGRPYTYRTFYEQLSNGLLSVQGQTYGYAALGSDEISYNGGTSTECQGRNPFGTSNCNGLFSFDAFVAMQKALTEALQKTDNLVDWTTYDGDKDGFVDLVVFIHPAKGGECGGATDNNHLWSHRSQIDYATHSVFKFGVYVRVRDYVLLSGVGGAASCDSTQIMPIGTVAHETGHGFGLPDLYDTGGNTEGIGQWGLMGSGNYASGLSPARMEAWSLDQLGWVTVRPIAAGTYSLGPAPTADTAFYLRVLGTNPRGEYFLMENRQPVQGDSALIRIHCQVSGNPFPPCGGGLLIWHVDSQQVVSGSLTNDVNNGPIHGLALVQADGLGNLDVDPNAPCSGAGPGCSDRGDAGDPYPGTAANTMLSPTSVPAARRNSDARPAGVVVDQIQQLAPGGTMSLRVSLPVTVVRATDTAAVVQVDGSNYTVYREVLDSGTVHNVSIDSLQAPGSGRTRYTFLSWSDGQGRSHAFTAGATPDTLVATLTRAHRLVYTATSGGTITANPAQDTSGVFLAEGTSVTLTATDTSTSRTFLGWAGDTIAKSMSITLFMSRPFTVRAVFLESLATADVVAQLLNGTGPLTSQQLQDLDQLGNNNSRFDVGDFLAWVEATGAPLTAEQRSLVNALGTKEGGR